MLVSDGCNFQEAGGAGPPLQWRPRTARFPLLPFLLMTVDRYMTRNPLPTALSPDAQLQCPASYRLPSFLPPSFPPFLPPFFLDGFGLRMGPPGPLPSNTQRPNLPSRLPSLPPFRSSPDPACGEHGPGDARAGGVENRRASRR
jgi:hypothetical protein